MTDLLDPGSSSPRPSKRRRLDQYYTPHWATQELLKAFPEIRGNILLDPCCGDGRMAKALASRFDIVRLNDIEPSAGLLPDWRMDARNRELYAEARPDWSVSNPPFLLCGQIAAAALRGSLRGLALLMRCTFLEPCDGREWLTRFPPTAILSLSRISFTGGGTDSAPCFWFVWFARRAARNPRRDRNRTSRAAAGRDERVMETPSLPVGTAIVWLQNNRSRRANVVARHSRRRAAGGDRS